MQPDVLMLDRIGGAYSASSMISQGLGGSELELLQVAKGLTAKGHSVVVANGVDHVFTEEGITYIPHAQAWQHVPRKALYLQRTSTPETRLEIPSTVRVIVRANDVYCEPYDVHRPLLESGRATLVANTQWQADQFRFAKERAIVPPMLEPMPKVKKQKGLFVFASGAMKGFDATVDLWCAMKARHQQMKDTTLVVVSPGWGAPRALTDEEIAAGIRYIGAPRPTDYRRWIAKAEGLFTVLTMPETFGCAAALAERAGTRTHILCAAGLGGLPESVVDRTYISESPQQFERGFLQALEPYIGTNGTNEVMKDLRPATVMDQWADVLQVDRAPMATPFPDDPTLAPNKEPLGPFFGEFLSQLRSAIEPGGSEFGAGLMLFALATAIQAKNIVEIGRFKGFSTLALAAARRLIDWGWVEPKVAEQRPDVDYTQFNKGVFKGGGFLTSIDPVPLPEADARMMAMGMTAGYQFLNQRSEEVSTNDRFGCLSPTRPIDLLLIDGGHTVADVRADIQKYVPFVRHGGYFILHDYYGWFKPDGTNGSPIAQVIGEDLTECDRILIDTGFASLVIFRKTKNLTERWELSAKPSKIAPRADGRPTVGLCIIAKGDEASTVATRAILSGKKAGVDCVTVVCDANDATAEIARSLGADVFIRPSPAIDWEKGIGVIAGARNEALAIAERRTDYILVLDADDHYDGTLPTTFDCDAYEVPIHDGSLHYARLQLFRSSLGWRYTGIIHETVDMIGSGPIGRLEGLRYLRGKSSYGYQDQDPPAIKFSKHAQLIRKWLIDHPDDTRAQFYLARSLQDAGRVDEAIEAYERRIAMPHGWDEERAHASYQIGIIQIQRGLDPTAAMLQAHEIGVPKAEPLVALARWYRDEARKQFSTAYAFAVRAADIPLPVGGLFIEPGIYQFEAAAEVAIAAYWLGRKQEALERFEALRPNVPPERIRWADEMIAICRRDHR